MAAAVAEQGMISAIEQRLADLGLVLPAAPAPAANYVPWRRVRDQIFVAGQLPIRDGKVAVTGLAGDEVSIEQAQQAAQLCALNILAQVKAACDGSLPSVLICARLGGFVACAPTFTDHPKVINGASDLMVAALGDAGRHARFAVGVASLPLGATVEIDATLFLG
jgi:enamine deaminase RidA (YjgF/YER057c/UK114 family)